MVSVEEKNFGINGDVTEDIVKSVSTQVLQ
jgi:hypothetical protein